eukprot:3325562-Karenia_brevis.AAC.1
MDSKHEDGSMDHDVSEKLLRNVDTVISFGENPHKAGSKIHAKFEAMRDARSIGDARRKDATLWGLRD